MTTPARNMLWPVIDGPAKGQNFAVLYGTDVLYVAELLEPETLAIGPHNAPPPSHPVSYRKIRYELRAVGAGFVWTSEPEDPRQLRVNPDACSLQGRFEMILTRRCGIKFGAVAIRCDGSGYVNPHIQWLWEQWK